MLSRETADKTFNIQEDILTQMRYDLYTNQTCSRQNTYHDELIGEVLTINYGHPSSEDNFERRFRDKIPPSDQSYEK